MNDSAKKVSRILKIRFLWLLMVLSVQLNAAERLQVRIWRTYYAAGDSVRIQAKLSDADGARTSRFIYVELLKDGSCMVVGRVKLRDYNGLFNGVLPVPDKISHGWYTLRVYTRAQKDWPAEALYHIRLLIRGHGPAPEGLLKASSWTFLQGDYPEGEREYSQELAFRVKSSSRRLPKKYTVTVVAQEIGYYLSQEIEGDSSVSGKEGQLFRIPDLDFPDSTLFSVNVSGVRNLFPVEELEPLAAPYDYGPSYEKAPQGATDTSALHKFLSEAPPLPSGNEVLAASRIVSDRKPSFYKPKRLVGPYSYVFDWRQVRLREEIQKYDDLNLMRFIVSQFPGFYYAFDNEGPNLYTYRGASVSSRASISGGQVSYSSYAGHYQVQLYIDGMAQPDWSVASTMSVRDVQNFYVLRGAEAALYKTSAVVLLETRYYDASDSSRLQGSGTSELPGSGTPAPNVTIGLRPLGYQPLNQHSINQ